MSALNDDIACCFATVDDADKVIALVEAVYGKLYSSPEMYDPAYVRGLIANRSSFVTIAQMGGRAIGLLVASEDPRFPETLQFSSLMTIHEERFHGTARLMHEYFFANFDRQDFRSISLSPVTFHTGSQHIAQSYGFSLCGIIMNGYMSHCVPLEVTKLNERKRTDLLAVRNLTVSDVGDIFVCKSLRKPVKMIYDSLGVTYRIVDEATAAKKPNSARSVHDASVRPTQLATADDASARPTKLAFHYSPSRHNIDIVVEHAGSDALLRIRECVQPYINDILLTFQLFWNVSDPDADTSTASLLAEGLEFNGLKPLGSREYALFYGSPHLGVNYGACKILEEYRPAFACIQNAGDRTELWGEHMGKAGSR